MCPICGNSIPKKGNAFCSVRCRNIHNARQQVKRTIKKQCVVCGKEFEVHPSDQARRKAIYCSKICKGQATRIIRPIKTKEPKIKPLCQTCGLPIQGGGKKYCSIACRSTGWQGEGNPLYKPKVQRVCEACGVNFQVVPAIAGYGQGRFCSRRCYAMWKGKQEGYSRGRGGKRPDLNNQYFRSTWEANYARYLNWLIQIGEILEWTYEPDTFEFLPIKRGSRFYTPDFRITNLDHSREYHEIKGWMDKTSQTKLNRMAKYYPEIKVKVIDSDAYKALARDVKRLVPNWETAK